MRHFLFFARPAATKSIALMIIIGKAKRKPKRESFTTYHGYPALDNTTMKRLF